MLWFRLCQQQISNWVTNDQNSEIANQQRTKQRITSVNINLKKHVLMTFRVKKDAVVSSKMTG